jgi:AraC family transcriptional activator of tynA and feaB
METFSFIRQNLPFAVANEMFKRGAEENARKFHAGETFLCDDHTDPHFELKMLPSAPYPTGIVRSRTHFIWRRTWDHIRDNKENLVVLRHVKTGTLTLTQGGNTCDLGPGDFALARSSVPEQCDHKPAGQQPVEWSFIMLPLDVVHRYFPNGVPMAVRLTAPDGQRHVITQLMDLLSADGAPVERGVADLLVSAMLKAAAEVASALGAQVAPRQGIGEQRLAAIVAHLDMHLANPELSLATVAQSCQISPRYLCHLLKERGLSFSHLLWDKRLETAHGWLVTSNARHYSISEIALMTGFKSAAHFSRMFRNRYGASPRELRQREATDGSDAARAPTLLRAA